MGGVFNAVNESVYQARANPHPIKQAYYMKDLADWSRFVGVKIGNPPVFPVRSVDAMRACLRSRKVRSNHSRLHFLNPTGGI